jgi:2,4-dienoyl-CoA reductase-like NADH-dependent reductase (Old Yellow Enzyme family)
MLTSLFQPFNLGNREFKNRIVAAPPPSLLADQNGMATPELADYYQRMAETGACAVIVEGTSISANGRSWHRQLDISSPESLYGLSRLVERIRQKGALPVIQLFHGGLNTIGTSYECCFGPSALPNSLIRRETRAMTEAMIEQTVQDYTAAAVMAWNAGFSGIDSSCHRLPTKELINMVFTIIVAPPCLKK